MVVVVGGGWSHGGIPTPPASLCLTSEIQISTLHLMEETKGVDGLEPCTPPPPPPHTLRFSLDVSVGFGPGVRLEPARSRVSHEHENQSHQAKHTEGVGRDIDQHRFVK